MMKQREVAQSYIDWLGDHIFPLGVYGDYFKIITPFIGANNESISIVVEFLDDDKIILKDGSSTIGFVEHNGFDLHSELFKKIASMSDCEIKNYAVQITARKNNIGAQLNKLMTAIMRINNVVIINELEKSE